MRAMLALALLTGIVVTSPGWGQNLLKNGAFTEVGADGLPANWGLTVFHTSPTPQVAVTQEGGRTACRFTFPQSHPLWCMSFHQALPDLDPDSELTLTCQVRRECADKPTVSFAISSGPGCNIPCARQWVDLPRNGEWFPVTVRFAGKGLNEKGNVLEFTAEREFKVGDRLYIADLRLEQGYSAPLRACFTDPVSGVVYTDVPARKLAGMVSAIRPQADKAVRVTLVNATTGAAVGTRDIPSAHPSAKWEFDFARLPEGKYSVRVELREGTGTALARQELTAWQLKPTATTMRIRNGRVYLGGKPVVLIGTYHIGVWVPDCVNKESQRVGETPSLTRDKMLGGLAMQGFDAAFFSWGLPPADFLEDAKRNRLGVMPEIAGLGTDWGGKPLVEQIAPFADDPRILAWGGWDEPSTINTEGAMRVYRECKSASPRKLVVNSYCQVDPLEAMAGQGTTADLVLMDYYRVSQPNPDLSEVGLAVRRALAYAKQHGGIAVGVTPQAFIYAGGLEPTPEQLRAQMYLGLVNGAQAFFPYAYVEDYGDKTFSSVEGQPAGMSLDPKRQRWFLPDSRMWAAMPQIVREIRALEEVIVGESTPLDVTSDNTAVQFMVKTVGGRGYLIAVNPVAAPQEVRFRFATAPGKLTPLFGTPETQARGKDLTVKFGGYEVMVVRMGK